MIAARVEISAGGAADVPEHAVIVRELRVQHAGRLQAVDYQRVLETNGDDLVEIGDRGIDVPNQIVRDLEVADEPARIEDAAEKPRAGELLGQAQAPFADAVAVRVRDGESRVVHNRAEIGDVVVHALQLEEQNAE